jgi:hypothetical protein
MKRLFYLLILSQLFFNGYSQEKKQNVTHYLFSEFTKGVVLMKTGVKNEPLLNFNSLTEEMIFENKGIKLAISNIEQIDTIYIKGRKFFPLNGKFFELILHSKYDLYAEHKCCIKDPGKPAAYGGSSQTSATTTYSTFSSGSQVYDLKLPESYETKAYTFYWLKKNDELIKFINLRQLSKIFGVKSIQFKTYTKEHDVSYDDQESLVGLIRFLETN